jgi:hypothetical protein
MYLVEHGHLDGSGTLRCHMNGHFFEPDHLPTHAMPFGPSSRRGESNPHTVRSMAHCTKAI